MPDFGFWELALLMLIALLVVGPQRLPRMAADVGGWIGRIKKMAQRFKADVAYELNAAELEKTIGKPHQEFKQLQKNLQETSQKANDAISTLDPLRESLREQIDSGRYSGEDESLTQAANKPAGAKSKAAQVAAGIHGPRWQTMKSCQAAAWFHI